ATVGDDAALTLALEHGQVRLRRITTADLLAIADAPSPVRLVARVIESREGEVPPVDAWWERAASALEAADPLAHLELALRCPDCATAWSAPCDVVAFVWAALDEWATTTLREVHRLTQAYGWAERDILALSPARRRRYLELVGT
ncbi:MAG: hypothetical protein MUF21_13620, partial [Gemmatimonadaceae bacterium]|nr:hypothetical protein [Gemmatimonadaceae bacterium]